MTAVLWSTAELPGVHWDPEPDDEDDGPWCYYPDLSGQGANINRLATMTTITLSGDLL